MRLGRAALVGAFVCAVLLQPVADAASPSAGTLLRTRRVLTFSGGPFVASQPNYLGAGCALGASDPTCDHFKLTVRLGDGAQVQVSVKTPSANPNDGAQPLDGDDYDLFVYAPGGALVAKAANTQGNETVTFTHRARYGAKPYEVRVAPWFVMPGSTYKGLVQALSFGG